ncbi:Tfp pilus assembly protein FimT/FimU [Iodobacter sp.]|uniref:pilus assembly FimT family protein n=1 Tax=Iodobacter sp. TaxID=1915058 RepID=UPI0025D26DC3|nr:type II secretion system protein [Iodobacter sp.]
MDSLTGKQAGFSLIELMITLVIFIMLMLAAVSLGSSWLVSSDLQKSESVLKLAHSKAKALAIRNATAANGTTATLQITGTHVAICPGNTACDASNTLWTGSFAKRSAVTINNAADVTISFDRNGLSAAQLNFSITEKGDQIAGSLV